MIRRSTAVVLGVLVAIGFGAGTRGQTAASRPQTPVRPFPYVEEEVTYINEGAVVQLAGTLTLPRGPGPFPAAILITGSGFQDRDESIAGHKPFLVLSDYLTRRGLAVLRSDDRGIGGSSAGAPGATTEDTAGDVRAAIRFLRSRSEVDPERIGLIGHSEGGLVAAMVAAESERIAFVVMLAGSGVSGDEILYAQAAWALEEQGEGEDLIAADRAVRARILGLIRESPDAGLEERLTAARGELAALLRAAGVPDAAALAQVDALSAAYSAPWFRFFVRYDPASALRRVRSPVLALIGERDTQVPAALNLPPIEAALSAGGNMDYMVREMEGLNHLFQTSVTGSVSEYSAIEETMSPGALELIADWILSRVE